MTALSHITGSNTRARSATWLMRPWVLTALVGLAATGLRLWSPNDDASTSICAFRQCTGISCPGCGMTRGLAYLMRGDIGAAWRNHPLALLVAAEVVLVIGATWALGSSRGHFAWLRYGTVLLAAHIPLFLGVWLVRIQSGTLPL